MEDSPAAPTHLILWDVDHTLISSGGVGRKAFAEAFHSATGLHLTQIADPSGLTEGDIFRQTAKAHGITDPEPLFPAFARQLPHAYQTRMDALRTTGRALPGARSALTGLAKRPEVVQGVLTGNIREVARLKLATFDLDAFIDWNLSAFAEDGSARTHLVEAARTRAHDTTGTSFHGQRTILIGDTPNDVQAALQTGASIIAVASGRFTTAELHTAGAETVVTSLEEPHLGAVLGPLIARAQNPEL